MKDLKPELGKRKPAGRYNALLMAEDPIHLAGVMEIDLGQYGKGRK